MSIRALAFAIVLATPGWADCPAPPDHADALDGLIAQARTAPDEAAGRALASRMWEIWAQAPDGHAQDLLDSGVSRREMYDYGSAMKAFDALVAYCPDYAEGYNQRGFIHFLREDFEKALPELDAALDRQPRHVAARAGRALTLMALGRKAEAALELRAALEMNPWLGERHLLPVLETGEDDL
ncbi:tetratricopeptide repeat protein [Roseovarius sp. A21]|uniref:Tetratricopeptide repeat protein n=1 Tax=Roseovarius bejariae TaxID=2576383 RepID=A0A844CIW8_9RHOB|nr:tetratricopeptide repeat protein [Roseovarius bejariae]MRU14622.1 tetratricopeptide repeat protein [Roseovarius bejariae]